MISIHSIQSIRVAALLGLVSVFPLSPKVAADDSLTSEQLATLLKELESIQAVVEGKRLSNRTSAVEMFREAASSDKAALEFYLDCVKMLRFDSRDAKFTEYRDWREKNEDKLKEKSNLLAMRLQLQYLVLTLRVAEGVDRASIVPELEAFVTNIITHMEDLEGRGMQTLREPVNRTVFSEAFELNQSLKVDNWSYSPGDYASVYEKTIFPYYRAEKPGELAAVWDRRIGLENRVVEFLNEDDAGAMKKHAEERLPRLQWQKAADVFANSSQKAGALAMIQILRSEPDHPDATKWLESLQGMLAGVAAVKPASGEAKTEAP